MHPIQDRRRLSRASRLAIVLPLAAIGLTMAVASCGEGSHSYNARRFDRERGCLGRMESLDSVEGDEPGSDCAIKCLVPQSRGDGGDVPIYVSTMCPPYPAFFDTTGTQPGCSEAMAAAERNDICSGDGGSSGPPPDGVQRTVRPTLQMTTAGPKTQAARRVSPKRPTELTQPTQTTQTGT
jgi:hypothetical protein